MTELVAYKSLIVILFLVVLFFAERYAPAAIVPEEIFATQRIKNNLLLWFCNSLLSPLIILPMTLYAVNYGVSWRSDWQGAWIGNWGSLLLDLLVLDLWIYWWHRANHRFSILWRFHRIHHLDQWLDVTSSVRFHFGEVIVSTLIRAAVIVCLGIPLVSVIIFETLVLMNAGFHHSNIRIPARLEQMLSKLMVN